MASYGTKAETEFAIDQAEAVAALKEKLEILDDMFHGFDWRERGEQATTATKKLEVLHDAEEFILAAQSTTDNDVKRRYLKARMKCRRRSRWRFLMRTP